MEREEMLALVRESWRQFDAALERLDETALAEPGVVEDWSVLDLLGHITTWEQVALRHVEQWRRGETPTGTGGASIDDFNAAQAARWRALAPEQTRAEAAATREQLSAVLESLSADDWTAVVGTGERQGPLGEWIGRALGGPGGPGTHGAEHAEHIWAWRVAGQSRRADQVGMIVEARRELLRAVEGMSAEALSAEGSDGGWPVRDLLAHIAAWDRALVRCVEAWLDGAAPPAQVSDVDAFNSRTADEARGHSLYETLLDLTRAHEDFVLAVHRAGGRGGDFDYPWGGRGDLGLAVHEQTEHEREHAAEISARRGQTAP